MGKKSLFYGTGNAGKYADVKKLIEEEFPDIELRQFDGELCELQTLDQRAIAIDKGRQAWNILKKPVFVDDAGFYLEKYADFPGVMSKFVFQCLGLPGIKKLAEQGDRAYYRLTLVFFYGDEQFFVVERRGRGTIHYQDCYAAPASLPFDAFFIPDGADRTLTELRLNGDFNNFDHRILAIRDLFSWIKENDSQKF